MRALWTGRRLSKERHERDRNCKRGCSGLGERSR